MDYTNHSREYLDIVKAISEIIKLPLDIKSPKRKSVVDLLMENYSKDIKTHDQ